MAYKLDGSSSLIGRQIKNRMTSTNLSSASIQRRRSTCCRNSIDASPIDRLQNRSSRLVQTGRVDRVYLNIFSPLCVAQEVLIEGAKSAHNADPTPPSKRVDESIHSARFHSFQGLKFIDAHFPKSECGEAQNFSVPHKERLDNL